MRLNPILTLAPRRGYGHRVVALAIASMFLTLSLCGCGTKSSAPIPVATLAPMPMIPEVLKERPEPIRPLVPGFWALMQGQKVTSTDITKRDILAYLSYYAERAQKLESQINGWIDLAEGWDDAR